MATRFGGVSPTKAYATKVKWLVFALTMVIVVLLVIVVIASQENTTVQPVVEQPQAQASSVQAGSKILVAAQRIEAGVQLNDTMFMEQFYPLERTPVGAVPAAEKISIIGKYSKDMVLANMPLLKSNVSDVVPLATILASIPSGYRAVTIITDRRSAVEYYARPNTRVDVLWTFVDRRGQRKVRTLVRSTKILSVAGVSGTGDQKGAPVPDSAPVTLLVTELDARRIELARTAGSLSLTLVGGEETPRIRSDGDDGVTIADLDPTVNPGEGEKPRPDGVMYSRDSSGRLVKYILVKGQWQRDNSDD